MSDGPLLQRAPADSREPPATPHAADGSVSSALSPAQLRIWLLEELHPGTPLHNVALSVHLEGEFKRRALQSALDRLVASHPTLCTSFHAGDAGPTALVAPPTPVRLDAVEVRSATTAEREEIASVLHDQARMPFDLAAPPLLRATLVRLSERENVLVLVTHEIACDRTARDILVRDVADLYESCVLGEDAPSRQVEASRAGAVDPTRLAEELRYWRTIMAGAPSLLELPTDHPRPPVQSFAGARVAISLDPELVQTLDSYARRFGTSLRAVLLAGFAAVLQRYSGQADIVIGTSVRHQSTRLTGAANTLALRVDLADEPSLQELVLRVNALLAEAEAHSSLPFERLVDELDPQRDLSRAPLFQVLFDYEEAHEPLQRLGLSLSPVDVETGCTGFDLTLTFVRGADSVQASIDYSRDLFEADTPARLLGHLQTLLAVAVDAPDTALVELPLLTEPERRLLVEWNATGAEYPGRCLHELVSEQAGRTPGRLAVVGADEALTYAELETRSNQLARRLVGLGVGPGSLVGICVERTPRLLVGLLGILKTGGAYVPLDPSYPGERLAIMLDDCAASVLVSESALLARLPHRGRRLLLLDRDWSGIAGEPGQPPALTHSPEQLAYVIYTSGSTGRPKGVEIKHRSVVNLLTHMRKEPGLGGRDVFVNLTTPAFDLSVPDWYLSLVCGARLVVLPREIVMDGEQLARRFEEVGATFLQATPTTWGMLVDSGWRGAAGLKIVCGGEPLSRALAEALLERGESVWHMYGPTETTVWSSIIRLESGEGPPPIGGPISNTTFSVLDERRQLVPDGVPGQLYIGGDGLARGYRNRPALTAEKFIGDPFDRLSEQKLYATGDLVRRRASGTLEFLGRLDHQVKIRGFRVELGEIEAGLNAEPRVVRSAVIVREDSPGDRRLVAYVVLQDGEAPNPAELRGALARRLPAHMLPGAFVFLDALPTSANGKIDRAALPAPDELRPELDRPYAPPRTPVEEIISGAWAEVLGLERVGIDDDFFQLGGNSLLATQAVTRLRRALSVPIPLRAVFELPTPRQLARTAVHALAESLISQEDDLATLLTELERTEDVAPQSPRARAAEVGS